MREPQPIIAKSPNKHSNTKYPLQKKIYKKYIKKPHSQITNYTKCKTLNIHYKTHCKKYQISTATCIQIPVVKKLIIPTAKHSYPHRTILKY